MTETFGEKVIAFNRNLQYKGLLPDGFRVLNPYLDNPETLDVMQQFYKKYYNDSEVRKIHHRNQSKQARRRSDRRSFHRHKTAERYLWNRNEVCSHTRDLLGFYL